MHRTNAAAKGDTFMINLRFLLIATVVVGNMIEPLIGEHTGVKALFMWIFTFHMPLFVFVTGYFARYSLTGAAGKKTLQTIGLQYVIFQTLYQAMDAAVFKVEGIRHSFFFPYLLCWFLMAHIIWRIVMILLLHGKVKHPVLVTAAVGVLIGYTGLGGGFLSIPRALMFMPFFVLGYHWDHQKMEAYMNGFRRAAAAVIPAVLFAVLLVFSSAVNQKWLYGSISYADLGHTEWYAGIYRIFVYALEFVAAFGLLAWVPRKESIMTDWGKRTLYVFLLHGFVVRFAVVSGLVRAANQPYEIVLLVGFALAVTVLLAQPAVKTWTHAVIEPDVSWLNRVERKAKGLIGAR